MCARSEFSIYIPPRDLRDSICNPAGAADISPRVQPIAAPARLVLLAGSCRPRIRGGRSPAKRPAQRRGWRVVSLVWRPGFGRRYRRRAEGYARTSAARAALTLHRAACSRRGSSRRRVGRNFGQRRGRARQRQIGNVCRAAAARVRGRARVGWSRSAFDPEDALQHGDENPTIREWRGRKPIDEHPNVIVRATHRPTQQCRLPGRAGQRVAPRCDRLDEAREPSVDLLALELAALALLFEARPRRRNVDEHGLREKI